MQSKKSTAKLAGLWLTATHIIGCSPAEATITNESYAALASLSNKA